jgi:hypothetical protein
MCSPASSTATSKASHAFCDVADNGPADSGAGGGQDAAVDGSGHAGSMNGCASSDYVDASTGSSDGRMIMVSSGKFDKPCMIIATGQSVMFMWDFSMYPLAPGLSPTHSTDMPGTTPTPIMAQSTGQSTTTAFPSAGFYPFYVSNSTGMAGVVEVK